MQVVFCPPWSELKLLCPHGGIAATWSPSISTSPSHTAMAPLHHIHGCPAAGVVSTESSWLQFCVFHSQGADRRISPGLLLCQNRTPVHYPKPPIIFGKSVSSNRVHSWGGVQGSDGGALESLLYSTCISDTVHCSPIGLAHKQQNTGSTGGWSWTCHILTVAVSTAVYGSISHLSSTAQWTMQHNTLKPLGRGHYWLRLIEKCVPHSTNPSHRLPSAWD